MRNGFLPVLGLAFLLSNIPAALPGAQAGETGEGQWPRWRGPSGTGISPEKDLPAKWDASSVVWKTPLKGEGQSSPIIWGDRIFLTSAAEKGSKRLVFCVDRLKGKMLWEHVAWTGKPEPTHKLNGWATASCATDGKHVYASFGFAGLHCYTVEGKHVWSKQLGKFLSKNKRGTAASPILVDDLVILNGDSDSDPFLFGIDKQSGETRWKTKRPATEGYSTPIVIDFKGKKQIVVNGHYFVAGYDPADGKQIWSCKSFNGRGEPTVTYADGIVYVVNGQPGDIYAVRVDGKGDVTKTQMVWHTERRSGRDQPSPLIVNGYLVVSNIAGIVNCYDLTTGKDLWRERIHTDKSHSSPFAANGLAYFQNDQGETVVIEPGPKLKIVARNRIAATGQETFRASITPCDGQLFMRSHATLFCIGKK